MEKVQKPPRSTGRRVLRIFLKTILFIFAFVLLVFLLVLTPPVQRFLTSKVEGFLEKKLQTEVRIGRIAFGLSGNVSLKDVYIEDKTKDTLISGGTIKAHLNLIRLFKSEFEVKDLELQNITAKVKRVLPDTTFNFQFIVDAFATQPSATVDTSTSAPLILEVNDITLENINLTFQDVITGSDMYAHIGNFSATIDTMDLATQTFALPTVILRNFQSRIKQTKPLVEPEPLAQDMADATKPVNMNLSLGTIDLDKISLEYANDVSALYTNLNIGRLRTKSKLIDLVNNRIYLDAVGLDNSKVDFRLGKKPQAEVIEKEVKQEVTAQKTAGWDIRVDNIRLNNNFVNFDNDNSTALTYGMDFNHIRADSLTLHADKFVMNPDSIAANVVHGFMKEKSGFRLEELKAELLYANTQAYLNNVYIKTPGTEIQRSLSLQYASPDELAKNFGATLFDINITDTKIQVKDVLTFAPQLRTNPALRNQNDIWNVNLVGRGTLDQLNIDKLQFDGFGNTQLNASGTLSGLMNPAQAGGNFKIYQFHTTQTDIAMLTGKPLSTPQLAFPEDLDLNGTIEGNAGRINTVLNLNTSSGFIGLNGSFSNLTNPSSATYAGEIRTSNLQVGRIIRQPQQIGSLTGRFSFNGKGITPETVNANFKGSVPSFGYNQYQYHNIRMDGYLKQKDFHVNASITDPNADLDLAVGGSLTDNPSFTISGMIDSVKTLPLHLSPTPIVFRGKIDGSVSNLTADNPDANVLITKALIVNGNDRLALDTIELLAGRRDTANYITFRSDIANADIIGQYRLADMGAIIQNTIQPYFSISDVTTVPAVQPYNFRFMLDAVYSPILSTFIPGLTTMEPIHAEGRMESGGVMNANLTSPYILINGNEISDLALRINTADSGLQINGDIARIKSGSSFDIFNTRLRATALNNDINFSLGIDDQNSRGKYFLSGLLAQQDPGTYRFSLRPDSLMLNYQRWTVTPDNSIIFGAQGIVANNFVLQQGDQSLSINSVLNTAGQPLNVDFKDFRVATLTGFIKADSLLVDGVVNGNVSLKNLQTQPAFTSNLTIANLSMRQDTLGDLNVQVSTAANNSYDVNTTLTGKGNDVAITGSITPSGKDMALDLDLNVRQLQLSTMEGAMASAITNASGAVTGNIAINGTTASPKIKGDLNFDKASFALTALGSQFSIDDEKISVTENGLRFDQFSIRDSADNRLTIDGNILTANFINYDFDLNVAARNFQVLNSAKKKGAPYYGKMNITSNIHIAGTEVKPVVDGSLTVNDGTELSVVVPQAEPGVQEREGVIQFVDMDAPENDSLFLAYDSLNKANVLGMDITANIEIKKEAIFNVVIDETNGDFLNVRGEAVLSAGVDPSGKITMVGNYTLEEGAYQLSFNFLQRRFTIEKGSTITWTGEPTTAQLNITAVYVANTAPLDLVSGQLSESATEIRNTYLQKLPFQVRLNLAGELLKPIITFDIQLPQDRNYGVSNDIITTVASRLDQLRQDEGEINKQVFSLLLLGRFVGEDPFSSSGPGFSAASYARQSASKLLTEQLNQLAGGLINGVDLDFDVASSDDYTTGQRENRTDLNVGLSKRLLNDRLKVSVGSNFALEGPQNSNQRNNNIAGNIAADYQLSKDGRYLLRFYRRNEYEGVVDGYIIETGLGFILSVDYNRFNQIFQKRRRPRDRANDQQQKGNQSTQTTTQP